MISFGLIVYVLLILFNPTEVLTEGLNFPIVEQSQFHIDNEITSMGISQNPVNLIQKGVNVWRRMKGKDEICSQNMEEMILTCGFLLLNDPLELKLSFQEPKKLECTTYSLTECVRRNCVVSMYPCPFTDEENTKYLVSQGDGEKSAIIFRQKKDSPKKKCPIAVVKKMLVGKELTRLKSLDMVTEMGKLHIKLFRQIEENPEEDVETSSLIQKKKTPSPLKVKFSEERSLDVCKINFQLLIFLCDQAAKQFDLTSELKMEGYTPEHCDENVPEKDKFKCPPVTIMEKEIRHKAYFEIYLLNNPYADSVTVNFRILLYGPYPVYMSHYLKVINEDKLREFKENEELASVDVK